MSPETLRVPLDLAWASELGAFLRTQMDGAPAPEDLEGGAQGVLQAGYARDAGLLAYAEGHPLAEVRVLLRRSAEYTLAVFQARVDPDEAGDASGASLTNSRRGREALELALACGAVDLARALAPLVWDPPGAGYLGPGSVVCTAEEQATAYALRDLLLGCPSDALAEVRSVAVVSRSEADRLAVLSALACGDHARFAWALSELHRCHLDRVRHPGRLDDLEDLLDLPALAYAALGRHIFPDPVPLPADAFLPLDLGTPDPELP